VKWKRKVVQNERHSKAWAFAKKMLNHLLSSWLFYVREPGTDDNQIPSLLTKDSHVT
jgi:hypothetical protein